MWFPVNNGKFIGKKLFNDECCEYIVSDFIRIWHKSVSNTELLAICKALNPLLEVSVQKLKELIAKLLQDSEIDKQVEEEKDKLVLKLQSHIMGVKFQFKVSLNQENEEMMYKEVTMPLMLTLLNATQKQKQLLEIIKNKDVEIKEYVQEFGIKPNYLTTKPFNEEEFNCETSHPDIFWDSKPILDCISLKCTAFKKEPEISKEKETPEVDDKDNKVKSIFKDKRINCNRGPNIFLSNHVIKKKRKVDETFKIRL